MDLKRSVSTEEEVRGIARMSSAGQRTSDGARCGAAPQATSLTLAVHSLASGRSVGLPACSLHSRCSSVP